VRRPIAFLMPPEYFGAVVTDLDEVFRLGTVKAEENLAFRRYLAAHRIGDTPFQQIAADVQTRIDCTACANCCRYSVVSVDSEDIANVAAHLGATPGGVAHRFTAPDPEEPGLRVLRNAGSGCVFLKDNLCGIYQARPKACRDFPHVAVGGHSLGGRPSSHARWAALCPIIYNALESYKHVTGYCAHLGPRPQGS
jgi:Fe-S-cluster containining protein